MNSAYDDALHSLRVLPQGRGQPSTAPTLADLQVLYCGRDRLLRVAEPAEHLGVCNATVYRLCERGELRHVWIVNSIRIRPDDLRSFLDRVALTGSTTHMHNSSNSGKDKVPCLAGCPGC